MSEIANQNVIPKSSAQKYLVISSVIYVLMLAFGFWPSFTLYNRWASLQKVGVSIDATLLDYREYSSRGNPILLGTISFPALAARGLDLTLPIGNKPDGSDKELSNYLARHIVPVVYDPNNPSRAETNFPSNPLSRRSPISAWLIFLVPIICCTPIYVAVLLRLLPSLRELN